MTWAAVAVGGASAVGSAAAGAANGGKKGSRQSRASEALSMEQAETARIQRLLGTEQAQLTQPLRQGTTDALSGFLQTGQTPSFLDLDATVQPLAALSLPALANQQTLMRNQLVNQGIRGGQLQQSLASNILQGGLQRTGLLQQDALRQEQRDIARTGIRSSLFGAASDLGTGGLSLGIQGVGSALSGLSNAAGNLNSLGSQRIQENMALNQGLGQLAGKAGGNLASRFMPAFAEGSLGAQQLGAGRTIRI